MLTLVIASGETLGKAIAFTLYEMAINPAVQRKAHEEIDSFLESHDGVLTYDNLHELKFLDMVIAGKK